MMLRESSIQGKMMLRMLLTLAFAAPLTLGLGGCKSVRFTGFSGNVQSDAPTANAAQGTETVRGDGPVGVAQAFSICTDCLLTNERGEAIHGAAKTVKGALESITVFGGNAQFKGWAADVGAGGSVKAVLIFADDRLVHMGPANDERYDVAQTLGDGTGVHSGFSVVLLKALFDKGDGKGDAAIRLFALTQAGVAAELPFKAGKQSV
jgi:hypothetical protein